MTAASLAAAIDLSWTKSSCSLFILAISCIFQASSRTIRSCSRFSMASKNLFCSSSCLSITSFISLWKKAFHFLFLLPRLSNSSSEEVEEEVELERKLAAMAGWAVGTLLCGGCRLVGGVGEGMVGIVGFAVEFVGLGNVDGTVI